MNQMIVGFVLWGATVPFTLVAMFSDWAGGEETESALSSEEDSPKV